MNRERLDGLSATMFELGLRVPGGRDLTDVAMPFPEDLCELTHESVHLGIRGIRDRAYRDVPQDTNFGLASS